MTRTRKDLAFGQAFVGSTGAIVVQSGDLRTVTRPGGAGQYDLTWNQNFSTLDNGIAVPFVGFVITGTGNVDFSCSWAAINGTQNQMRVTTFVAGVATDSPFIIIGTKISTRIGPGAGG